MYEAPLFCSSRTYLVMNDRKPSSHSLGSATEGMSPFHLLLPRYSSLPLIDAQLSIPALLLAEEAHFCSKEIRKGRKAQGENRESGQRWWYHSDVVVSSRAVIYPVPGIQQATHLRSESRPDTRPTTNRWGAPNKARCIMPQNSHCFLW